MIDAVVATLFGAFAVLFLMGWMRAAVAVAVWPIALLSIVARDQVFGGEIYVWPFLLAACVVAYSFNRPAAILLAVCVAGSQILEQMFSPAMVLQFAMYSTLGFIALWFFDKVAAATAAIVSMIYLTAAAGVEWRDAVIASEIMIVLGLCVGVIHGPSGGIGEGVWRRRSAIRPYRPVGNVEGSALGVGAADSHAAMANRE